MREAGLLPGDDDSRAAVARALESASPTSLGELPSAFARAQADARGGRPVLVVEGQLSLCLRAHERLRKTSELAELFVEGDKRMRAVVDRVRPVAARAAVPAEVADALRRQLVEAFQAGAPGLGDDYLDATVERQLIEDRSFVEHTLMGGPHLRALLDDAVVYLPRAATDELPLALRFRARLVAELRLRQDAREQAPFALRCLALATLVDLRPRVR
jgi:hypothetical protein